MSQYASSPFPPCWSPLSRTCSSLAGLCLFRMGKGYFLPPPLDRRAPWCRCVTGSLTALGLPTSLTSSSYSKHVHEQHAELSCCTWTGGGRGGRSSHGRVPSTWLEGRLMSALTSREGRSFRSRADNFWATATVPRPPRPGTGISYKAVTSRTPTLRLPKL